MSIFNADSDDVWVIMPTNWTTIIFAYNCGIYITTKKTKNNQCASKLYEILLLKHWNVRIVSLYFLYRPYFNPRVHPSDSAYIGSNGRYKRRYVIRVILSKLNQINITSSTFTHKKVHIHGCKFILLKASVQWRPVVFPTYMYVRHRHIMGDGKLAFLSK